MKKSVFYFYHGVPYFRQLDLSSNQYCQLHIAREIIFLDALLSYYFHSFHPQYIANVNVRISNMKSDELYFGYFC